MNLAVSLQGLPDFATRPGVQRAMRYLPLIATVTLVVVLAWQLARLTWSLWPASANMPIVIQAPIASSAPKNGANLQKVVDAHLFGLASAADEIVDPDTTRVTNLPLVLAGVMATTEPTQGFAFIGESAQAAKFKRVGDPVPGGAKLHSVYPDKVMLDRGGQLESLLLPRFVAAGTAAFAAAPPPVGAAPRFADLRRMAEANPSAFTEIVRPSPNYSGSALNGYRVYPGRNRQQFAKLGLQPADLITAVNGTPLTDQSNSMQIFNTIATTDRVTLTIVRNGQPQQLVVNTAQFDLSDPNQSGTPPPDPVNEPINTKGYVSPLAQ